jgi:hypothetical protein
MLSLGVLPEMSSTGKANTLKSGVAIKAGSRDQGTGNRKAGNEGKREKGKRESGKREK